MIDANNFLAINNFTLTLFTGSLIFSEISLYESSWKKRKLMTSWYLGFNFLMSLSNFSRFCSLIILSSGEGVSSIIS